MSSYNNCIIDTDLIIKWESKINRRKKYKLNI